MSGFKGTPGPWVVFDYEIFGGDGNHIIDMTYSCRTDVSEDKANGQLISAAPELLEALQLCEEFMSMLPSVGFDGLARIEGARAAIAKALGEKYE